MTIDIEGALLAAIICLGGSLLITLIWCAAQKWWFMRQFRKDIDALMESNEHDSVEIALH